MSELEFKHPGRKRVENVALPSDVALSEESASKVEQGVKKFLNDVQGKSELHEIHEVIEKAMESLTFDEKTAFGHRIGALRKPEGGWDPPVEMEPAVPGAGQKLEKKRGRRSSRGGERKIRRKEASTLVPKQRERTEGREKLSSRAREIIDRVAALPSFQKALTRGLPLVSKEDLAALEDRKARRGGEVPKAQSAQNEEQLEFDLRAPPPPKSPDQYEMDLGESPEVAPSTALPPKEAPPEKESAEDFFFPDTATPEIYETFPDVVKPLEKPSRMDKLRSALRDRSSDLRARAATLHEGGKRVVGAGFDWYQKLPRWQQMIFMGTVGAGLGAAVGPGATVLMRMISGATGGALHAATYASLLKAKRERLERGESLAWYHPLRNPGITAGMVGALGAVGVSQSLPEIIDALKGPAEDAWKWVRETFSPDLSTPQTLPTAPELPASETTSAPPESASAPTRALPVIEGNKSVWSALTEALADQGDPLGSALIESGAHVSERGRQAFAHAFQRAVESGGFQNLLLHNDAIDPARLAGMAWNNIPDGTTVDIQGLLRDGTFRETLSSVLAKEYPSLVEEITGSRRGNVASILEKMLAQ